MTALREQLQAGLPSRYRLEGELGEGGMAIVFRATDLTHQREVAIKVLKPELSAMVGTERFLQEIQLTAKLQHPHILPLYDSGAAGPLLYFVAPLITGESLRERLKRERQLPVEEAVALTRAIAEALDYAHRQGVLHRDIKPENILLQDRQPLLADFGIALAVHAAGTKRLTQSGLSIGTPSYMSPEQLAGDETLDARSDVYALACVAYETLTGVAPFAAPTFQATVAAVMTGEPKLLIELRRTVPDGISAAIHRALERLPADRYESAAEFAAALSPDRRGRFSRGVSKMRTRRRLVLAAAAGAIIGAIVARLTTPVPPAEIRRWNIVLPDDAPVSLTAPGAAASRQTAIALSPAGDRLAYTARRGGTTVLVTRSLDSDSVVTLPGTEGAYNPFFSPDGGSIAFFAGNLLRKISENGGNPVTIAEVDRIVGAAWPDADRILVLENEGFDQHWISASGARADSIVHLTTQFGAPDVLPGGEWAVGHLGSGQLALLSLKDGTELAITRRGVLPVDSVQQRDLLFATSPRWVESGFLVYATGDGVLTAMPFDGRRRTVIGEPVPLFSGVRMEAGFGFAEIALSRNGTLVYVPGQNQLYATLAFASPDGRMDTLPFPRAQYTQPRLSPDGKLLAVQSRDPAGGWEVLLLNLVTGARQQVVVAGNYRAFPASWIPSGRELLIGIWNPVQYLSYGARIQSIETGKWIDIHLNGASYMSVAHDGKSFVFSDWRTGDLYLRSLGADTTRLSIPARGFAASFSPDDKWVAWGGVNGAVAVSPVPPTGAIYQVAERGQMPLWTPKGDGLIFRDGTRYLKASISTIGGFHAGRPQVLLDGAFLSTFAWNHDIGRDGRLLVLLNSPQREARTLGVITGFPRSVARVAGVRRAP